MGFHCNCTCCSVGDSFLNNHKQKKQMKLIHILQLCHVQQPSDMGGIRPPFNPSNHLHANILKINFCPLKYFFFVLSMPKSRIRCKLISFWLLVSAIILFHWPSLYIIRAPKTLQKKAFFFHKANPNDCFIIIFKFHMWNLEKVNAT